MDLQPQFRYLTAGVLMLGNTWEANREKKKEKSDFAADPPELVHKAAVEAVWRAGGDTMNKQHVFGQYIFQVGQYKGRTFKWLLENCLGYAAYFVQNMKGEKKTDAPVSQNKHAFRDYFLSFPECLKALKMRAKTTESAVTETSSKQHQPSTQPQMSSAEGQFEMTDEDLCSEVAKVEAAMHYELVATYIIPQQPSAASDVKEATVVSSSAPGTSLRPDEHGKPISTSPYLRTAVTTTVTSTAKHRQSAVVKGSKVSQADSPSATVVSSKVPHTLSKPDLYSSSETYLADPSTEEVQDLTEVIAAVSPERPAISGTVPSIASVLQPAEPDYPMIESWKDYIPKHDQRWISRAIFTRNAKMKPEIDSRKIDRIWWYPPQPQLLPTEPPRLDRYFGHRLLLWMPRKLWRVKLYCPYCKTIELSNSGPYRLTRFILDIDSYYILAGEYLHCSGCKKNQISWSESIVNQLDIGHRSQFPVVITRKHACDIKVIRLLRQRAFGNSPTLLQKKLAEQHSEARLSKTIQYMNDCSTFKKASEHGLIVAPKFEEVPPAKPVPTYQWLQFVYCLDVLQRLDEVKASVTSVFGRVLKMDSTKKITKKLAGKAAHTAAWCTNIGNEHGQVLQSVMTAGEGYGLEAMVKGIIKRYSDAKVSPPEILYVDSQCCGRSPLMNTFRDAWPHLYVRLDIWHFMRRFAVGVTTDTHRLYATFMAQLSHCIFQWDKSDLALLKEAKRRQMIQSHIADPTEQDIIRSITRKEMALHCRRSTRGEQETTELLLKLLEMFDSDRGHDTMGVPLLHHDRIWEIWKNQKNHIACIQDPPGIPLYIQTGTLKKGGIGLPVFRCSRGSTSLESFHLHLQRFIPGTTASASNFQAYLVEGLRRWNEDRAAAAVATEPSGITCYSSLLRHTANDLGQNIFGKKLFPSYNEPRKYTGEKIGIEYLYSQTGDAMDSPLIGEDEDLESQESRLVEEGELGEDIDEGFIEVDDRLEIDDPTITELTETVLSLDSQTTDLTGQKKADEISGTHTSVTAPAQVSLPAVSAQTATISQVPLVQPSTAHQLMMQNRPSRTYIQESSEAQTTKSSDVEAQSAGPSVTDSTPTSEMQSQAAVGPGNIGGYEKVVVLAEYLISLRENTPKVISNDQATHIIALWNNMNEYDKMHTKFSPRFRTSLVKGRFKQPKTTRLAMTPGVDSVRRCFLGSNAGPAQWPNCNRYVEVLVSKLCSIHRSPLKSGSQRISRWNLVNRDYEQIRSMIYGNQRLFDETGIQLPSLNTKTIQEWFNTKDKQQDRGILEQGLQLQTHKLAPEPLPLPLQKPSSLISGVQSPHTFQLPENTAGQTTKTRRRILPDIRPSESPSTTVPIFPKPTVVLPSSSSSDSTLPADIPYSTMQYRKRKIEKQAAGEFVRTYTKTAEFKACRKCGKDSKSGGHRQYFGNVYCPEATSSSYAEWRANLVEEKGYGKKKKSQKE